MLIKSSKMTRIDTGEKKFERLDIKKNIDPDVTNKIKEENALKPLKMPKHITHPYK